MSADFELPRRNRVRWWVWGLALVVHASLVLVIVMVSRNRHLSGVVRDGLAVQLPSPGRDAPVMMDLRDPTPLNRSRATPPASAARQRVRAASSQQPAASSQQPAPSAIASATVDTPPHSGAPSIRPRYGDGRLWVQPLPESPRRIASALTGQSPAELADSAVAKIIQSYLEEMAKERAESPTALPSWTTKIGGKTVGLDQKWIYLGPLKIPTALLALLPIKLQGNMSNYQFNQQLQQMRADLFEAARRSENYDEFKEAVKDLHQQKEHEREFKRNQRTPPDTSKHG